MARSPERMRTRRLDAERVCADHLPDLLRMHADPQVMATLGGLRDEASTREWLAPVVGHWDQHGFGLWMFRDRESGHFAGRGGLRRLQIDGAAETEVAYALMPEFWGRGLASEIARASIQVAFESLALADLVCFTLPTNRASRRVMERAGFRYEKDVLHADLPHVLYRLEADAW